MNKMLQRENLSAYLDKELTEIEQVLTEEKLRKNPELKKELDDYKFVKHSVQNLPSLPEDDYFYAKLHEKIHDSAAKNSFWTSIKKPVVVFSGIAILFMVVLKLEPSLFSDFFKSQQENIADLYTKNLQPLLYTAGFSSEDIFNFAFNNVLPLDKESNQVLKFGKDGNGQGILELKEAGFGGGSLGLEEFAAVMGLHPSEKKAVDSILKSYTDEIASAVLVNENNTLAVNSNIWDYKNALQADLISYVTSLQKNVKIPEVAQSVISPVELRRIAGTIKNIPKSDLYYMISSDTAFSKELDIDHARFDAEWAAYNAGNVSNVSAPAKPRIFFKKGNEQNGVVVNYKSSDAISFHLDSNSCKVVIPKIDGFVFSVPDMDSLVVKLDSLSSSLKNLTFNFKVETKEYKRDLKNKTRVYADSLRELADKNLRSKTKISIVAPDSLFREFNKMLKDSMMVFKNYTFNEKAIDSLLQSFKFGDSLRFNFSVPGNLHKELELLRKEMNKFREEMENFRKESKPQKKTTVKPIEI